MFIIFEINDVQVFAKNSVIIYRVFQKLWFLRKNFNSVSPENQQHLKKQI